MAKSVNRAISTALRNVRERMKDMPRSKKWPGLRGSSWADVDVSFALVASILAAGSFVFSMGGWGKRGGKQKPNVNCLSMYVWVWYMCVENGREKQEPTVLKLLGYICVGLVYVRGEGKRETAEAY